jgi:hypothetical protein
MCMPLKYTFPVQYEIIKPIILQFYTLSAQYEIIKPIIVQFYTSSATYVQCSLQSRVTRKNLHVLVESIVYALKVETVASSKIPEFRKTA